MRPIFSIADGRAFGKMDAFAGIMWRLGGRGGAPPSCAPFRARSASRLYDRVARNRYALFGRHRDLHPP